MDHVDWGRICLFETEWWLSDWLRIPENKMFFGEIIITNKIDTSLEDYFSFE